MWKAPDQAVNIGIAEQEGKWGWREAGWGRGWCHISLPVLGIVSLVVINTPLLSFFGKRLRKILSRKSCFKYMFPATIAMKIKCWH